MIAYLVRRLIFVAPTLLGIITLNFFIIQAAPGGPVEQMIARLQGEEVRATARFLGSERGEAGKSLDAGQKGTSKYRGARGLDPQITRARFCRKMDMPMAVIRAVSRGDFRSGR